MAKPPPPILPPSVPRLSRPLAAAEPSLFPRGQPPPTISCRFQSGPAEEGPGPSPGIAARPSPRGAVPAHSPPPARSRAPGPLRSPAPGGRRPRPLHHHPRGPRPIQPRVERCRGLGPPGLTSLPGVQRGRHLDPLGDESGEAGAVERGPDRHSHQDHQHQGSRHPHRQTRAAAACSSRAAPENAAPMQRPGREDYISQGAPRRPAASRHPLRATASAVGRT